jgi:hypothetical protein
VGGHHHRRHLVRVDVGERPVLDAGGDGRRDLLPEQVVQRREFAPDGFAPRRRRGQLHVRRRHLVACPLVEAADPAVHDGFEPGAGRVRELREPVAHPLALEREERREQPLLVVEVVVDERLALLELRGDLRHRQLGVSVFHERRRGRVQDGHLGIGPIHG